MILKSTNITFLNSNRFFYTLYQKPSMKTLKKTLDKIDQKMKAVKALQNK